MSSSELESWTASVQHLKASSDGAVTAETGWEFQRRIVEEKKELL